MNCSDTGTVSYFDFVKSWARFLFLSFSISSWVIYLSRIRYRFPLSVFATARLTPFLISLLFLSFFFLNLNMHISRSSPRVLLRRFRLRPHLLLFR